MQVLRTCLTYPQLLEYSNNFSSPKVASPNDLNTLITPCGIEFDQQTPVYIQVTDCSGIGISEFTADDLNIYPNPSDKEVHISIKNTQNAIYQIVDTKGVALKKGSLKDGSNTIHVESIDQGYYVLIIQSQDKTHSTPIIITH